MNDRMLNWLDEYFRDEPLPDDLEKVGFRGGDGFGTVVIGSRGDKHAWAQVVEPQDEEGWGAEGDPKAWVEPARQAISRLAEYM